MHYLCLTYLSLFLLFTDANIAGVKIGLEPRLVCHENNALRAFQASTSAATSYCQTYIHIPTSTVFVSVAGVTPVTKTVTTTLVQSIYPDGHNIETLPLPIFLMDENPTSVSIACSCISVTVPAVTSIASLSTQTTTTTVKFTSTVTGICATQTRIYAAINLEIPYGNSYWHSVEAYGNPPNLPDSYQCCEQCFNNPANANCIGWAWLLAGSFVECSNIYETPQNPTGTTCPLSMGNATYDPANDFPLGVIGAGPCPAVIECCS